MSDWSTYRLSDFLLFSHRVYLRLFELYNAEVWPLHVVTSLIGAAILIDMMRGGRATGRFVTIALGALWLWIAWGFLQRYTTINWAAAYVTPAFVAQGLALVAVGLGPGLGSVRHRDRMQSVAALLVMTFALIGYPLLAPALGRPFAAAEVFGMAPDPTAVATLAVLSGASGSSALLLWAVPLAWIAISGLTLWTMDAAEAPVAPLAALVCIAALVHRASKRR